MSDLWSDHTADRIVHVHHIGRAAPAVADLARRCAALAERVTELEGLLADERRRHALTRAVVVPSARKAPVWWIPLAWLGIVWDGHCGSYAYEPAKEEEDTR